MALPTNDQFNGKFYLSFGSVIGKERVLLDVTDTIQTAGNRDVVIPMKVAANTTNNQINLASYVDSATYISVRELTTGTSGFKVDVSNAATKPQVTAGGLLLWKNGAATPPTLYIDNPDAALEVLLEISILGSNT